MAERDRKMVKHIFEMKENYNKFRQLFRQQAEDLLKKLDKHAEEKQKSVMHDMMDEWSCFCKGQDRLLFVGELHKKQVGKCLCA